MTVKLAQQKGRWKETVKHHVWARESCVCMLPLLFCLDFYFILFEQSEPVKANEEGLAPSSMEKGYYGKQHCTCPLPGRLESCDYLEKGSGFYTMQTQQQAEEN